jgi:allophanate hydrolase subunit 1
LPGGWNIIGRTPARLFDVARPEPFLFQPGDTVRFEPIPNDEYDAGLAAPAERTSRGATE